jgi:hypothetical protein
MGEVATTIPVIRGLRFSPQRVSRLRPSGIWGSEGWYTLTRVRGSVTDNNGFWIWCLDLLALLLQLYLFKIAYNSSKSVTAKGLFRFLLDYECLLFHGGWLIKWLLRLTDSSATDSFLCQANSSPFITSGEPYRNHRLQGFQYCCCVGYARNTVVTEPVV